MQNDALLLRSRNFASICSTGEKRGIAEQGIEISDSNLNSAFERQPCSAAKQLEVGTVCAVWHKKTAEKWALSPLRKNRFKLAPRVPKPRFKKLVKNCQRFSSFILFFPQSLLFLSSTNASHASSMLRSTLLSPIPGTLFLASNGLFQKGLPHFVPYAINIRD